jgi:hypothetical protein
MRTRERAKPIGLITIGLIMLLIPSPACADAGLPMVAVFLPSAWLLLIPIILIESWYGTARCRVPFKRSLLAQTAANALSTIIGLPITWGIVLLSGVLVLGPVIQRVPWLAIPLFPLELLAGSAWLGPGVGDHWWSVPLSVGLLCVPFFAMSVAAEGFVVRRFFPTMTREVIRHWVLRSNLITYALLIVVTTATSFWPLAQAAQTETFMPVTDALLTMLTPALDPDRDKREGTTPLMKATSVGNYDRMRMLIAEGADVNAADRFGWTSLHRAAGKGDEEAVRILLAGGARVNIRQAAMGTTPLHQAAYLGDSATVRVLIASGADPNEKTNEGWTPLMEAMLYGDPGVAQALIESGANVNARSKSGWTALKEARYRGDDELSKRLADAGAIDYADGTR